MKSIQLRRRKNEEDGVLIDKGKQITVEMYRVFVRLLYLVTYFIGIVEEQSLTNVIFTNNRYKSPYLSLVVHNV